MTTEVLISTSVYQSTVRVTGQFALTEEAAPIPAVNPVVLPGDLVSYETKGAGFFAYDTKTIITAAQNVIIPPELLVNNNRFPFVSATQPLPAGVAPSQPTQMSNIIVTVNDCNGCNEARNYVARLVGVDASGDNAVLRLIKCCDDDGDKLHVKDSRVVKFTDSEYTPKGANLYTYSLETGFLSGEMTNSTYSSPDGSFVAEHILTNFEIDPAVPGMPVVDQNNYVVGMLTQGNHGPSTRFFKYVTDRIMYESSKEFRRKVKKAGLCKCFKGTDDQFVELPDARLGVNSRTGAVKTFRVFLKSYLGVLWSPVDSETFNTVTVDVGGVAVTNLLFNPDGTVLNRCGVANKGIQLTTLAGAALLTPYLILPGLTPVAPFGALVDSPVFPALQPGNVITRFGDKCEVPGPGNQGCNVAPGIFMWRNDPDDYTTIRYKTALDNYNKGSTLRDVNLVYKPLALDFPPVFPTYPANGPAPFVPLDIVGQPL